MAYCNDYRATVCKIVAIDSLCNIYYKCCIKFLAITTFVRAITVDTSNAISFPVHSNTTSFLEHSSSFLLCHPAHPSPSTVVPSVSVIVGGILQQCEKLIGQIQVIIELVSYQLIFTKFDPALITSASLAQVHVAHLHNGQKVQHTRMIDTTAADYATVELILGGDSR
ncbi:hypothetical protein Cgig2_003388 [Carnegiea gigantea]|uniref:ABC1 atypical kinase-like domain-containing protein n=1 Tax=Carnegiea gigantea TaxID=171969 RepID=A0A9Q1JPX7_9CARY|nr:hypothetical protein Cgig2_003388 [Carnegiea gigantea]